MSKKIFVVDDDPVIRTLVGDVLSMHGHTVETYEGGADCLIRLKRDIPDIIIVDMQMPEMTGAEMLQQVRANPLTSDVTVVMLSANSDIEGITFDQYQVKANRYIQKPFEMKQLVEAVSGITSEAGTAK